MKDDITKSPRTGRLTPPDPAFEKKMAEVDEFMTRYRNTLHALAARSRGSGTCETHVVEKARSLYPEGE